jgi:predicted transposase YdaD
MATPFDAATKQLLELDPVGWARFLGGPPAAAVAVIEADLATVTAEADKVLLIRGNHPWLMNVELQSSYDATLEDRLLRYNVLLRGRHELPVRSVVVLLRRQANAPRLTGVLRYELPGDEVYLEFRYHVVRLWRQPAEHILNSGVGVLPLAPLADVPRQDLPPLIEEVGRRFRNEAPPEMRGTLWTATFVLMGLRFPPEFVTQLLQGVREMEESSTYQHIIERGRAEGEAREARNILMLLAGRRFGPAPPSAAAALNAISDRTRLEQLAVRVLDARSWEDLLLA